MAIVFVTVEGGRGGRRGEGGGGERGGGGGGGEGRGGRGGGGRGSCFRDLTVLLREHLVNHLVVCCVQRGVRGHVQGRHASVVANRGVCAVAQENFNAVGLAEGHRSVKGGAAVARDDRIDGDVEFVDKAVQGSAVSHSRGHHSSIPALSH